MKQLFVTCPHGFEFLLRKELRELGIEQVAEGFCGVFIPKNRENIYLVNYLSRIATRVLWPITQFLCKDKEDLYQNCRRLPWSEFMSVSTTFAIDANVTHPNLTNSLFASLVVKDAICDFFRDTTGSRPSVDKQFPDVQLNLFIQKGKATLYVDTSGAPLHKRGWRDVNTEATLHESLAAALLLYTGYTREKVLCDPFCGSGTFLVEAAMIATDTPPGFLRKKWGFFHLPEFDKDHWTNWRNDQDAKRVPIEKRRFFGSDKNREASDICKTHLRKLGFASAVEIHYEDIEHYSPSSKPDYIMSNPPYGKRLETSRSLLLSMGAFLRDKCERYASCRLLYPEEKPLLDAGFETRCELSFKNGGLPINLFSVRNNFS